MAQGGNIIYSLSSISEYLFIYLFNVAFCVYTLQIKMSDKYVILKQKKKLHASFEEIFSE